jgi:CheY-like chemotaxis protein
MQTDELQGKTVLVVEDEFLIAMEIESILIDAGADVLGPCASVAEALGVIEGTRFSAASLDIRLGYETSEPIALALTEKGIPFVFYSGQVLPETMRQKWPDVTVLSKPVSGSRLISCLAEMFVV